MSAGHTNEETPETRAILENLKQYVRNNLGPQDYLGAEDIARDVARICGVYREQRVPL